MKKIEYALQVNSECDGTKEDIMEYCPSDWFMGKEDDICSGKGESRDCEGCWNTEKREHEQEG